MTQRVIFNSGNIKFFINVKIRRGINDCNFPYKCLREPFVGILEGYFVEKNVLGQISAMLWLMT